ncbi:hypothetical protein ACI7BZ_09445 [Xanthobacter sp. AM11]|uniref:hypothetical protein n=1 Tax=Xanthobacter sp. AM11 TaxID=3380643 RepID=UPI0039BF329A
MSERDGTEGGQHYHYHFYGAGPAPQVSYDAPMGAPGWGFAPPPPGFAPPPGFGPGQPAAEPAPGGPNWHRHPGADSLVKGLIIGAGAAYLLTNETAQRTLMRTAVQVWSLLQGSMEELKERLHDAEAEVAAARAAEPAEPAAAPPSDAAEAAPVPAPGS